MKQTVCISLFLLSAGSITLADNASQQELLFINPGVTTSTNIHFNENYCTECHFQQSNRGGGVRLRYNNYTQTCRCHGYAPDTYTHPVDIPLSAEKKAVIPAEFPLQDDKITCNTCHNMVLQCEPKYELKHHNKAFLRTDSSQGRTFLCFQCHKDEQYKMFNPHTQLNASGAINPESCLYCHETKPDEQHATLESRKNGKDTVHLVGDLETLCLRCHPNRIEKHPLNKNHLIKPSEKVSSRMHWSERNLWIVLPLNDEGKITCITCHNPHERGVIPTDKAASAGASDKGRLRKAWGGGSICVACHDI